MSALRVVRSGNAWLLLVIALGLLLVFLGWSALIGLPSAFAYGGLEITSITPNHVAPEVR